MLAENFLGSIGFSPIYPALAGAGIIAGAGALAVIVAGSIVLGIESLRADDTLLIVLDP